MNEFVEDVNNTAKMKRRQHEYMLTVAEEVTWLKHAVSWCPKAGNWRCWMHGCSHGRWTRSRLKCCSNEKSTNCCAFLTSTTSENECRSVKTVSTQPGHPSLVGAMRSDDVFGHTAGEETARSAWQ